MVQEIAISPADPAARCHNRHVSEGAPPRAAGESEAFRALYERHGGEILRYAIRCVGRREVAEELASEAFLKLYESLERVDADRAGAWLTAVVKNLAVDYWRRQDLERRHHKDAALPVPAGQPLAPRWEQWLQHASLKAEHRVCLLLHYVHGMSNREIMDATGLSQNQVKNAIQYGLKLLRQALGGPL